MNILKSLKFKKIVSVIVCLLIAFSFSGCSVSDKLEKLIGMGAEQQTERPTVRITFPEGTNVFQIANMLEENGVCTSEAFLQKANDTEFLKSYAFFENVSLEGRPYAAEGYLFPDTYDFYVDEGAEKAISRFLDNTEAKLDDSVIARCNEIGMTLDEVVNLASLIQEEAGNPAEMPMISSVLHNRLESPSFPKLQCDASSFYLLDYVKPYTNEAEYEIIKNAYSTYICEGLSEGPITNPGIDAINAALSPAESDYYFFCSDAENNYYYAETFDEHNENCVLAGIITN